MSLSVRGAEVEGGDTNADWPQEEGEGEVAMGRMPS